MRPWDALDFLFFGAYAYWNYFNLPFLLAGEGFELELVAAKGCPGGVWRTDEAACALRRLPCGSRVHGPAHNSLRSLRSLRSDSRGEHENEARVPRADPDTALLGDSQVAPTGPRLPR